MSGDPLHPLLIAVNDALVAPAAPLEEILHPSQNKGFEGSVMRITTDFCVEAEKVREMLYEELGTDCVWYIRREINRSFIMRVEDNCMVIWREDEAGTYRYQCHGPAYERAGPEALSPNILREEAARMAKWYIDSQQEGAYNDSPDESLVNLENQGEQ